MTVTKEGSAVEQFRVHWWVLLVEMRKKFHVTNYPLTSVINSRHVSRDMQVLSLRKLLMRVITIKLTYNPRQTGVHKLGTNFTS